MGGGDQIVISGAREHNLKDISLALPRNALVVITGLSGSGKSSLAFDTIYAEGQRRYVESLSAYARQFLGQMDKPDVDSIEGLSPAISIDQKTTSRNPRSTVGTVTEIYDYLRLLWARVGKPHCHICGRPIEGQSAEQIIDHVMTLDEGTRFMVLAPVVRGRKGEYGKLLEELRGEGFTRVKVDGDVRQLDDPIELDKKYKHDISVVVDRLVMRPDLRKRLADSVETCVALADGLVDIELVDTEETLTFSEKFACPEHGPGLAELEPRVFSFNSPHGACPRCTGLGSQMEIDPELIVPDPSLSIGDGAILPWSTSSSQYYDEITSAIAEKYDVDRQIARLILREVEERLRFLDNVGVGYLSLERAASTLSGGEAQRIRLATQIGSSLVGVLYILDEPSIGLHQRDNARLIATLERLRDIGNTVVVVEHDEEMMRRSDWLVDMGPGAGLHGGEVVAEGPAAKVARNRKSVTGQYLSRTRSIAIPERRDEDRGSFRVLKASQHNLKKIDVEFQVGKFICVTGVSGSGKSTLVNEIVFKSLANRLNRARTKPGTHRGVEGIEVFDKVIDIDQKPIGRTPRSNPATYTDLFTHIRELYSLSPEAKVRGYKPGRFSFNVRGGRCETCKGDGQIKIEMHFLPDVYVPCETCKGARYNRETLEVRFKGKSIAEVLDMSVEEALTFFAKITKIRRRLQTLHDVGLDYIKLGQPATTLSGGEAQRVKLAAELSKVATGKTLYILDEPTTGLHFADIEKLLETLQRLVDAGNTMLVIEHNLDVIKQADWLVDLGPEGGEAGGEIVATGTPEDVARVAASFTGRFLQHVLPAEAEVAAA